MLIFYSNLLNNFWIISYNVLNSPKSEYVYIEYHAAQTVVDDFNYLPPFLPNDQEEVQDES
jgi:hypothetical protein